jgi:hypothetical protein
MMNKKLEDFPRVNYTSVFYVTHVPMWLKK